jgi:hypothetical protein
MKNQSVVNRKFNHDQRSKPFIERGAEVVCPHCRAHIAFVVKQINPQDKLTSRHFLGPGIRVGAETKCYRCGMPWFLAATGQIHLRSGWVPKYESD